MANKSFSRLVKIVTGDHTGGENEFSRLERFAHFWTLVGKSFSRNRCPVRAAALSYTTLLAMIPLLAVAIGVTSSLLKNEGEEKIYYAIDRFVSTVVPPGTNSVTETNSPDDSIKTSSGTPVVSINAQKTAAKWIHDFVQNIKSATFGVVGMLLLVVVAIRLLSSIEATFNDIWGVTRGRNLWSQISNYFTIIALGPALLIAAFSLASGPHFHTTKNLVEKMPLIGHLVFELLPLVVLWLTFALFYLLVPNTKVKFSSAIVGGFIGGTLWHLNNVFGFLYASRMVTYSKIYGSLGLVPVFMAGLYFSWVILLFGAQVAYAFQNRASYLQEKLVENVNQRGKEFIALRLMTLIGQRFQCGEPPVTLQRMSAEIGIPSKLVQQILQPLLAARIVTEIAGAEAAFTPARPLDDINAHHILRAMRVQGQETATRDEPVRAEVLGEFAKIEEAERDAASKITVSALVNRAQKQIEDAAPKSKK
ncbi:MAG TPA: YhjD/YihY/BrkB family envelope integrity protein [Methylomirabilota bacterium]|nr:YhjD/YihY/BrkB family envelope integrity protein [Methylomirabilota bacterium]